MRGNSKKIYAPKSFLGIEKALSPLAIREGRCAYSKNLLYCDGILKKRNGWEEIHHFTDEHDNDLKIYGIYPYKDKVIYHAGQYLFIEDTKISGVILPECVSFGYEHGENLYIACGGELYAYDGVALTEIYDSQYSYIPTTTKDISPISEESTEVIFEQPSAITSKRKNTLIGAKEKYASYLLDTAIDTKKPIKVRGKMYVEYGSESEFKCPYNALYNEAERLSIHNIERVMGLDDENAEKLFTEDGVAVNLSLIGEINAFLREPIKVTEAIFKSWTGTGLPRMSFHKGSKLIYDTQAPISGAECNLTAELNGKVIDQIVIYGNDDSYILKSISIYGNHGYTGNIEIEYYESAIELNRSIKPRSITDAFGKGLSLYATDEASMKVGCNLFFEDAINGTTITFDYITVSNSKGGNFEIEFSQKDAKRLYFRMLEHCKTDTGLDALALSDGKSLCIATINNIKLYAPYSMKIDFNEITALSMSQGGNLMAFGKNEATAFALTKKDGSIICSLTDHASYGGAVNAQCAATVNFDTISLSSEGIFGSDSGKGRVRRAEVIEKMLPSNMENGVAIQRDGCYYLFINGGVYVADTRLKSYDSGRIDSDFQYEWFYLDNIPASYVAHAHNTLLIGRDDGRVVSFHSGYSDIYYEKMHTGSYLFSENEDGVSVIYINKDINVSAFDTILLNGGYSLVCGVVGSYENEDTVTLTLDENELFDQVGCLKIYPSTKLSLMDDNGEIVHSEAISVDGYLHTVTVKKVGNNHTYHMILQKNQDTEYTLQSQENHFVLLDGYGKEVKLFYMEEASVSLKKSTPVMVEYESAPLLKNGEAKRLFGIEVELTEDTEGVVTIEHETDKRKINAYQNAGTLFNMDTLNFNSVSFNTSLKKKCSMRAYERNFDYVTVRISHSASAPFGLIGYSLSYE